MYRQRHEVVTRLSRGGRTGVPQDKMPLVAGEVADWVADSVAGFRTVRAEPGIARGRLGSVALDEDVRALVERGDLAGGSPCRSLLQSAQDRVTPETHAQAVQAAAATQRTSRRRTVHHSVADSVADEPTKHNGLAPRES